MKRERNGQRGAKEAKRETVRCDMRQKWGVRGAEKDRL